MTSKQISLLILATILAALPLAAAEVTVSGSLQLDSPEEYSLVAGEAKMI
jgi:hypothetical protein